MPLARITAAAAVCSTDCDLIAWNHRLVRLRVWPPRITKQPFCTLHSKNNKNKKKNRRRARALLVWPKFLAFAQEDEREFMQGVYSRLAIAAKYRRA